MTINARRAKHEEREREGWTADETEFWKSVNSGYCVNGCDVPLRRAVRHIEKLTAELAAVRATCERLADEVWKK